MVDGERIGSLSGFRFRVDPTVRHGEGKLLLAAAERHVPALLATRAQALADTIADDPGAITLAGSELRHGAVRLALLDTRRGVFALRLVADPALDAVPEAARRHLLAALERWLEGRMQPLAALRRLDAATRAEQAGPELRALLLRLVEAGGMLARDGSALDRLDRDQRAALARIGVRVGTLDLFVPAMLRPVAIAAWRELAGNRTPLDPRMPPVVALDSASAAPMGYRRLGAQGLRIDLAERLLRDAHTARAVTGRKPIVIDPATAVSMGLSTASFARLLRLGGFQPAMPRALAPGAQGPVAPPTWRWKPQRRETRPEAVRPAAPGNAFAALAELVR